MAVPHLEFDHRSLAAVFEVAGRNVALEAAAHIVALEVAIHIVVRSHVAAAARVTDAVEHAAVRIDPHHGRQVSWANEGSSAVEVAAAKALRQED